MCSRAWGQTPKTICRIYGKPVPGISDICKKCKAVEEEFDKQEIIEE